MSVERPQETVTPGFDAIADAIAEIRAGRVVIVVDDEDRENEGDFILAAAQATPEAINFLAKHGRGLICAPTTGERLDELGLGPMVADNTAPLGTAFSVSVDYRPGMSTGISAEDRARTVRALLVVTNLGAHLPDADEPDETVRAFRLILDRG